MAIHMNFGNSPPWTRGYDDITCERMKEYCRIGFGYAWMNFYPKTDFETGSQPFGDAVPVPLRDAGVNTGRTRYSRSCAITACSITAPSSWRW